MSEPELKLRFQGIGALGGEQARPLFRPPDLLTAVRLPLAVLFLTTESRVSRLVIIVVTALSDALDGIWARRVGGSRLGAILDPVADKVFMACGFVAVYRSGVLHPLEILGALIRDIVAVLGFLAVALLRRPTVFPARAGGKAVTVCQLLTLWAFALDSEYVRSMAWATAAVSIYAIADYSRIAWTRNERS
jgi:phosphatidylglycerophosphate synthase